MSSNDNNQPSLVGGRTEYVKGATEQHTDKLVKAAIGNMTGSHAWKSSGKQAKSHAVDTMKAAGERGDPSHGFGVAEQKLGELTGCEGMANEGATGKKRQ
ncbi:hypothetical protein EKO27_g1264 [Xylaria grammica]|uniref:CsbD-like domain-containing protein n=1 Tax=Xylaria grammica TaxID=363999 RepID=A0A439DHE8_9PEZI|nr:hypothetical protein EKO27_g1264 [Xylaria grammica]